MSIVLFMSCHIAFNNCVSFRLLLALTASWISLVFDEFDSFEECPSDIFR
jgi:hypothetical protein